MYIWTHADSRASNSCLWVCGRGGSKKQRLWLRLFYRFFCSWIQLWGMKGGYLEVLVQLLRSMSDISSHVTFLVGQFYLLQRRHECKTTYTMTFILWYVMHIIVTLYICITFSYFQTNNGKWMSKIIDSYRHAGMQTCKNADIGKQIKSGVRANKSCKRGIQLNDIDSK